MVKKLFVCELNDICNKTWREKRLGKWVTSRTSRYRLRVLNMDDFSRWNEDVRRGVFHNYDYIEGTVIFIDTKKINFRLESNTKYVIECEVCISPHKYYIDRILNVFS